MIDDAIELIENIGLNDDIEISIELLKEVKNTIEKDLKSKKPISKIKKNLHEKFPQLSSIWNKITGKQDIATIILTIILGVVSGIITSLITDGLKSTSVQNINVKIEQRLNIEVKNYSSCKCNNSQDNTCSNQKKEDKKPDKDPSPEEDYQVL